MRTDRANTLGSLAALVVAWSLSSAQPAAAEELGSASNLVFAAERMFGLYIDNQSIGAANSDATVVALGWNRASNQSALSTPRLGIDFFLGDSFTLGGVLGFYSANVDVGAGSTTTTGVLFGGRAGYALRISRAVSFWPRGGLTYQTTSIEDSSQHMLTLTLDAPFTLSPAEHIAILVGPVLEVSITGKQRTADFSETLFGLMIGLAGWAGL